MLWKHYVFKRGDEVHDMWSQFFSERPVKLLYIAGRGFDIRVKTVLAEFLENVSSVGAKFEEAELVLVGVKGYELDAALHAQTAENAKEMTDLFGRIGKISEVAISTSSSGEDDLSSSNALRIGVQDVLAHINNHTDIILDISSMPRIVYLSLLTSILKKLIPDTKANGALIAKGVNFQVIVGEDAKLDGQIHSEEPSKDLVVIPGFSSALHAESVQDWPIVWFPILGEQRISQFEKVMEAVIPESAEICPIIPHPSTDPRRGDRLVSEYRRQLFTSRQTPMMNIVHAHESHPFEAYRQLLSAMNHFKESLSILGGCRLVVTPLASKLITVGAGLACFEMRPPDMKENYGVAIPYAEAKRYIASVGDLKASRPEIAALVLTGEAYA
jgi:hypothetical protein